jgi:hypothetical protein
VRACRVAAPCDAPPWYPGDHARHVREVVVVLLVPAQLLLLDQVAHDPMEMGRVSGVLTSCCVSRAGFRLQNDPQMEVDLRWCGEVARVTMPQPGV